MILGIVAASPYEAKILSRVKAITGKVYSLGPGTIVAVAGAGEFCARVAAEGLLAKGAGALLNWGVAAGLQPGLLPGELVMPTLLLGGERGYRADRSWHAAMKKRLHAQHINIHQGSLVHSDSLLTLPAYKRALHHSSAAVAVDRESAAVAAVAQQARVPFLTLKAIADPAEVRFPAQLSQQQGGLSPSRMLTTLGPKPWEWLAMMKLSRCFWVALSRLEQVARALDCDFMPPARRRRQAVS